MALLRKAIPVIPLSGRFWIFAKAEVRFAHSLPVRGLTELTREGEVPVWGVKWPVVSCPVLSCPVRPSEVSHVSKSTAV